MRKRTLCCDKGLVISVDRTVYIIGIDIAISNISASLHQAYPCVLKWFQVSVPVQINLILKSMCLLIGQVLLCLREFPKEPKFRLQIAHLSLSLEVGKRDACLQLLDFVQLVNPFIRDVLRWLRALYENIWGLCRFSTANYLLRSNRRSRLKITLFFLYHGVVIDLSLILLLVMLFTGAEYKRTYLNLRLVS